MKTRQACSQHLGGTSTGAGPRILFLSTASASLHRLIDLLCPYILNHSPKGGLSALQSCLLFCFCVEERLSLVARSASDFPQIWLRQTSRQRRSDTKARAYPACRLSLHQPPRGGKIGDRSVGNAIIQCRGRPKRMAASAIWDYIRSPLCTFLCR